MNHKIEIRIAEDPKFAAKHVALEFAKAIRKNPSIVLGLATGGTPVEVYRFLVDYYQKGEISFEQCTTFNLDEYVGLGPKHEQSYRYFMQQNLFNHIDVPEEKTHVPDGIAQDLKKACQDYEAAIKAAGGIDLQLLGIGENGHIAFNEPGSDARGRTEVVELTENTITANSRFFGSTDDVPRKAVSLGIGTILEAKEIILMATGESKAKAVARALEGEPCGDSPASFLQTTNKVIFVLDLAASKLLSEATCQAAIQIS